ncbi:MAG: hypothetical protein WBW04_02105 [Nitrolancea sp.]
MLLWAALIFSVALLLIVGVERLLRRLGITPERPEDASSGFRDVLHRIEEWQREHERKRR